MDSNVCLWVYIILSLEAAELILFFFIGFLNLSASLRSGLVSVKQQGEMKMMTIVGYGFTF